MEFERDWKASSTIIRTLLLSQTDVGQKNLYLEPTQLDEMLDLMLETAAAKNELVNQKWIYMLLFRLGGYSIDTPDLGSIRATLLRVVKLGSHLKANKLICIRIWKLCRMYLDIDSALAYITNDEFMQVNPPPPQSVLNLLSILYSETNPNPEKLKIVLWALLKLGRFYTLTRQDLALFDAVELYEIITECIEKKLFIPPLYFKFIVGKFRESSREDLVNKLWEIVKPIMTKRDHFASAESYRKHVYDYFISYPSRPACEAIVAMYEDLRLPHKNYARAFEWAENAGLNDLAEKVKEISMKDDKTVAVNQTNSSLEVELMNLSKQGNSVKFFTQFDIYVENGGLNPLIYNLAINTLAAAKNLEAVTIIWKEMTNKDLKLTEEALTAMVELMSTVPNSTGYISQLAATHDFNERQTIALIRSTALDRNAHAVAAILELAKSCGTITSALFSAAIQAVLEYINADAANTLIDSQLKASNGKWLLILVTWGADLYRNVLNVYHILNEHQLAVEVFDKQVDAGLIDTGSLEIMRKLATANDDELLLDAVVNIQRKIGTESVESEKAASA